MAARYKYNKMSGALQEASAPVRQRSIPSPIANDFEEASITASHSTQALTRAMRQREEAPAAARGGRDGQIRSARKTAWHYIVDEGQQVLLVDNRGRMEVVEGPKRVLRWGKSLRWMDHYVAHPGEFLVVRHRDGRQEHMAGPSHFWLDPRQHIGVEKEEAAQIGATEAVVVYSEADDGAVSRRVVSGPTTFVPAPGEWLHEFSWHGTVDGQKVPHALVFQKLWLMPDQMYHDVAEVRTADDAVLTIKLMIFFELLDVEKLLATSHDPIGDFVNAATSDVVEFLGQLDFEAFKKRTDQLNQLDTYKQLTQRAEQCGYRINKVVYRGYGAPPALQEMHDQATKARTRLQLERATEAQAQELEDLKLDRTLGRAEREREAKAQAVQHRLELQRLEAEETRSAAAAEDERQRQHLKELGALGVDLTALLTQGRADQVIEVRGGGGPPHVHLKR